MVPLLSIDTPKVPRLFLTPNPHPLTQSSRLRTPPRRTHFPITSISQNPYQLPNEKPENPQKPQPRTLFPGGYKRPEIKVPGLVLQLDPNDVLGRQDAVDLIDKAVAKWVRIVLLNGGEGSRGGRLYEAACLLKSVVRDRAYLLISERVDVAAAVGASGVVLSDQGLPAIVARNTMIDSKSESVILPLVARNVQTANAALNASNSEGADFLIYDISGEKHVDVAVKSVFENVKIPIFVVFPSCGEDTLFTEASNLFKLGASGLVFSLEGLGLFGDDVLRKLFTTVYVNKRTQYEVESSIKLKLFNMDNGVYGEKRVAGFVKLEDREKQIIETERTVLLEAINVIQKAAPLMEEVSLLVDAVSQIDEPFLLVIVGEFNSGKSTVINALLGRRYLKEGVVPTTNEITFLRYTESDSGGEQRCERHPDGQYMCYLPAPILKEMIIVDTPGTNVILQRQQRLTEEFVPRADLVLFVISADRPLTQSEVAFLRYIQQWKKKVVFVLNKSDLYQNDQELEEAISFIKENARKFLNTEHVTLYPVSARSALEAKLSASFDSENELGELSVSDSHWKTRSFYELEKFLYSFLDGSTSAGVERIKLKLGTPIGIAERLLSTCESLVRDDCRYAKQDLASVNDIVGSVKDYAVKMESESISWRRKTLSLIDTTKSRVLELIEATLQLSNLDLVASFIFKGEKSGIMPATSRIQIDIIGPALLDAKKLLGEYVGWLQSSNAHEGSLYKDSFEKRWPSYVYPNTQVHLETYESLQKLDRISLRVIENFSVSAATKLFEQEIREVFLGTFGGLGAAGLSASLLTSVLPTTLEDLLALGLCSAGGFIVISNFPARRQGMLDKVRRSADAMASELEEAMQKDLLEAINNVENFVNIVSRPYQDAAQHRLDKLLEIDQELSDVEKEMQGLQSEIQNLHV
ncbi:probable transmembrane GTPase FZO-like, chloroplastic isoform X1 [Alnus glutinosa]|uniref:probable transmembrane GTPase FZO-like, chloroplastic isoform X1 n=1 Tax=Alnus glutinosa TaxID=3517 RepID=UPI002D78BDCB|nr:probable transmembrane GTPase FZO-like, chloroplastic isoform X1 [Alnus glutinosa]